MRESKSRSIDRASSVYRALREAIIEQALEPGQKLPEDAIGERFGVSRTLVRNALSRLAAEGLVDLRRNHGATVAKPDWDEARDVFELRQVLERMVMLRLSGNLTPSQIDGLTAHVAQEEAARGYNEPQSIRLAGEFHILLAGLTGVPLLKRYVGEVTSRSGLILALYGRPHSAECAVSEHSALIAALAEGNGELASALMASHLAAVADRALIQTAPARKRPLGAVLDDYSPACASTGTRGGRSTRARSR